MSKHKNGEESSAQSTESEPRWVTEMHEHFQRTGFYRPQDIQRVLGDPRESVEIRLDTPLAQYTMGEHKLDDE